MRAALRRRGQREGRRETRLDLHFHRFERTTALTALPADLAVLMVGVTARQAASPTAATEARRVAEAMPTPLLAPADGAFNGAVAALLAGWRL